MLRFIQTVEADESVHYQDCNGASVCFTRTSPQGFGVTRHDEIGNPTQAPAGAEFQLDQVPSDDSKTSVAFRAWRKADDWLNEQE